MTVGAWFSRDLVAVLEGASAVLLFGVIESKLAQPRNLLGESGALP